MDLLAKSALRRPADKPVPNVHFFCSQSAGMNARSWPKATIRLGGRILGAWEEARYFSTDRLTEIHSVAAASVEQS